jgi:hypothetical protein
MKKFKPFFVLIVLIALTGLVMAVDTAITVKSPAPSSPSSVLKAGTTLKNGSPDVNYLVWPPERYYVILLVNVTSVADIDNTSPHMTIMAGDNPPSFRSGLGDLNFTADQVGNFFIGPLESARFKTADGYLKVYGTNITAGSVSAIEVRR